MRLRHVIQRGNHFQFVCRVPKDLRRFFPTAIIWKPLKASSMKSVNIACVLEQKTQNLFLQLRCGMLSSGDVNRILNLTFIGVERPTCYS